LFDFYQKLQILSHIRQKNQHRRRRSFVHIASHPAFSTVHRSMLASISRPLYSVFIAARNHACRHEGERTMKHANFRSFAASLEDVARDIVRACRRGARTIAAMLACCIALAFVISILPLALFLFVLFMGIKVVVGAFVVDHRRMNREQFGEHYGKQ
jgi:hypothetical protein